MSTLDAEILKQAQLKRIKAEAAGYASDSIEIEDEGLKILLKALSLGDLWSWRQHHGDIPYEERHLSCV